MTFANYYRRPRMADTVVLTVRRYNPTFRGQLCHVYTDDARRFIFIR